MRREEMSTKDEIAERKAVMELLSDGRPRTVGQVAKALGWKESQTEWALSVLIDLGEMVRTKAGKYGLVKKEEPQIAPGFKKGKLEAAVLDMMVAGKPDTAKAIWERFPEDKRPAYSTVYGALRRLWRRDLVQRVAYGKYRRPGPVAEGDPLPPLREPPEREIQEVLLTAKGRILGDIHVSVNITCSSLEEVRAVMQALTKSLKGVVK